MKYRKVAIGSYAKLGDDRDTGPQHFSHTSKNGLMKLDVIFGMVRPPDGEDDVRDGFTDLVAAMREFADVLEKTERAAPRSRPEALHEALRTSARWPSR